MNTQTRKKIEPLVKEVGGISSVMNFYLDFNREDHVNVFIDKLYKPLTKSVKTTIKSLEKLNLLLIENLSSLEELESEEPLVYIEDILKSIYSQISEKAELDICKNLKSELLLEIDHSFEILNDTRYRLLEAPHDKELNELLEKLDKIA